MLDVAWGEIVCKPSFKEAMPAIFSLQTLVTFGCYFCTFGAELSINSILGAYYLKNFKVLGQTRSGRWAAMFGLLNIACRLAGGLLSDAIYARTCKKAEKYAKITYRICIGEDDMSIKPCSRV